ncbi:MAG: phosphoribosylglycinamide formyltransferase [Aquiluna sp.]
MLSIVVLISGTGSNLKALLEACDNPLYPAKVLAVGADRAAEGLEHAELFDKTTFVVQPESFASKDEWAEVLASNIDIHQPDLIVLAGFMRVLPRSFVDRYYPRIINLHPSLLPKFPGAHAVRDALAAGADETGSTIHIVDAGVDTGPIIAQQSMSIAAGIGEHELHEQIKEIEKQQLVKTIESIANGEIKLEEIAA